MDLVKLGGQSRIVKLFVALIPGFVIDKMETQLLPHLMVGKLAQKMGGSMQQNTKEKGVELEAVSVLPAYQGEFLMEKMKGMKGQDAAMEGTLDEEDSQDEDADSERCCSRESCAVS